MQFEEMKLLIESVRKHQCEMQNIEIKAANQGCPTRLYDTLSSFSNQDSGGVILFGLSEKDGYEAVGVYDPQDLQHRVAEQCKQMEPAVRPLFSVGEFAGKTVVSAEIPGVEVSQRPVYYKGSGRIRGSYIRVGDSDEPMSEYEIYSYDAYHRRVRDDIRRVAETDKSWLDKTEIEKYLLAVKENKRNIKNLPADEILNLMGIVVEGKPTLTGLMCFSKFPQAAFPQLCITAVLVPGTYIGQTGPENERFIDNQRIEGTIHEMLGEAMVFVKRNMKIRTIIGADGARHDKEDYPPQAVREAILNALMHRDYSHHTEGTPVRICMYSDRMEIINPGGLYGTLTLDELGKIHADTRNKTLATTLEILRVAENRYSGIPTIREELRRYHRPEPVFENRRGMFRVVFYNGNAADNPQDGHKNELLLDFCREPKTRAEIAAFLGLTQFYAIQNFVNPLVRADKLRMTIPEKPKSRNQRFYAVGTA